MTPAPSMSRRPAPRALGLAMLACAVGLAGCSGGSRPNDPYAARHLDPAELPAAIAQARLELQASPDEPYWPYRLGELQVAADSLTVAETSLKQALWIDPYYPPALALLSKLYFDQGRHEEAIGFLEVARSEPSAFPDGFPDELRAGLAVHYDAIGELETAESLIESIEDAGDEAEVASAVTYVKLRGEGFESARSLAEHALEQQPKSAVNLNNYGITRLQAGDPHAATQAFEKAIEIDPSLPGPYYNMAIVEHFYFLDGDAAKEWFARYWKLSQEDPDALAETLLAESPGDGGK